jgi:hypothetical protein
MRGRTHICLLVCGFALALAGCGSNNNGTIPPDEANNLLAVLAAVEKYADEGNCELAQSQAAEFISRVNALPNDVDNEVAGELTKAATNLDDLAANDCTETGASGLEEVQPDTTATETTEPETTVTETSTPEEETTTEEPPAAEEQPEEEPQQPAGGGQDQGGSQGGGNATPTPGGGLVPPSGGVEPGGKGR